MISKTKIVRRARKKTNPQLAEAIYLAKKRGMIELAEALSVPTRKQAKVNISELANSQEGSIVVPGKVLSCGEIGKRIKVFALGFSEAAKEKLRRAGCETGSIVEALKAGEEICGKILR